jgi:hypothetical protein
VVTPSEPIRCPNPTNTAAGPPLTTPLDVWRARGELPACIAPFVPDDVDFSREMIAADLYGASVIGGVKLEQPAKPPRRERTQLIIEEQAPVVPCPPCRGVHDAPGPQRIAKAPLVLWRLPLVRGVTVYLRVLSNPMAQPCPPPTCS